MRALHDVSFGRVQGEHRMLATRMWAWGQWHGSRGRRLGCRRRLWGLGRRHCGLRGRRCLGGRRFLGSGARSLRCRRRIVSDRLCDIGFSHTLHISIPGAEQELGSWLVLRRQWQVPMLASPVNPEVFGVGVRLRACRAHLGSGRDHPGECRRDRSCRRIFLRA